MGSKPRVAWIRATVYLVQGAEFCNLCFFLLIVFQLSKFTYSKLFLNIYHLEKKIGMI